MNLPTIPNNFSSGEVLSAARLNQLLDWMRRANEILREASKQNNSVTETRRVPAGTDYTPPHPFYARVIYNDAEPTGVAVSGGGVYVSVIPHITCADNGGSGYTASSYVESFYQEPETIDGNPAGKKLYWKYDRETDSMTFELTEEEPDTDYTNPLLPIRVKIAEFEEADGITLVSQFLRSDIFVTRTDFSC
ncbi:MAG: hypothetical protein J6L64_02720 [Opitutales bacterium]|nr:hypothetical protein [Opitutales bacterium]